jgi:hypothetical protein
MSATGGSRFGYSQGQWDLAKDEMRRLLVKKARTTGDELISYSQLVAQVRTIRFEANDYALPHMLGEISTEEDALGRGMLTVLVVHQSDDGMPGSGFFDLARQLGRDVSDRERLWAQELARVISVWSNPTLRP